MTGASGSYSAVLGPFKPGTITNKTDVITIVAKAVDKGGRTSSSSAKVSTIYGDEVSKIHPVRDTLRFFKLLKRLKREAAKAGT